MAGEQMFDELMGLQWPTEFIVEYVGGKTERLLRGEGVLVTPAADDPDGEGLFSAALPKKHPANQKQCGRIVRFSALAQISTVEGRVLWSRLGVDGPGRT